MCISSSLDGRSVASGGQFALCFVKNGLGLHEEWAETEIAMPLSFFGRF
jgi:hypothetical protein